MKRYKVMKEGYLNFTKRPRRNRSSKVWRSLVQETDLCPHHFVAPFFVVDGKKKKEKIEAMPGVFRYSIDCLLKELESYISLNISSILLFCCIDKEKKDPLGSEATRRGNLLQRAISAIKKEYPDLLVMADIALDPFTSHGHDGLVEKGKILNDPTVEKLAKMSLLCAEAGVDIVAPSDMMDGRVGFIRKSLDKATFSHVGILSYSAKYASSFYGPFREALSSTPSFGDKKSYQMNVGNLKEALLEAALDEEEGADLLLVKPALTNLDIISKISAASFLPVGAYQVSGEYSSIMAAAQNGWIDEKKALYETLLCIKRAGASFIITYAAKEVAQMI